MVVGRVSEGGMDAVLVVQGVTKAKDEGGIIRFKLKFDLDSLIGLKNSIKFQDSMPWVRCAFGNVFSSVYFGYHVFVQQLAHPMYTHLSSL